jgi:hypothetical protein
MARPAGIEPTTHCLEGSCSIQLSYGRAGNREFIMKNEECGAKSVMNEV